MKKLYTVLLALCCFNFANTQTNYPILTLEEIGAATIVEDEVIMVVVENLGEVPNLAFYDLEKKEVMQKFSAKLPENPIAHIVPCDDGLLYLISIKKNPEQGPPLFDAIYSFDYKTDKTNKLYTEEEKVYVPKIAAAVHTKLVFSSGVFRKQPRLFNVETAKFEPFSDDENMRMLCASDSHNSYVVFKTNEMKDDDTVPVYVMDKKGNLSEEVGIYDSRMVASSNKEENRMPGFTITNPGYNWVEAAHDISGFPLSGFAIAMHPGLAEKYGKTSNLYDTKEICAANANYMAAKGKGQFWVYNIATPTTEKPKTVSDEDMKAIQAFVDAQTEYVKTGIQSAALAQVFDARFYSLTEKIKVGDFGYSEYPFIAFKHKQQYDVLVERSMLTKLIKPNFTLGNEQNAATFQDALNALYPPGTFDKKHIQCYKSENCWCFVRAESFGDKKGFAVHVDSQNKVQNIEFKNKLN